MALEEFEDKMVERNLVTGVAAWLVGDAPGLAMALSCRRWGSLWLPLKLGDALLRGVGQVCFANSPASGLLVLVGLLLAGADVGLATVLCSLVAILMAKALGQPDSCVCAGLTSYSAVLVGSVTAALHPLLFQGPLTLLSGLYMMAAAAYSVPVGVALTTLLRPLQVPFFTLPFNVATSILFLVLSSFSTQASSNMSPEVGNSSAAVDVSAAPLPVSWDELLTGSLLSAGQVYGVQHLLCSVLTLLALAVNSPLLALVSYLGGLVGTLTAVAVSGPEAQAAVVGGVWGYNGFLAAGCAVFFLKPSWRVLLLALFNAVSATLMQAALVPVFAANKLPVLTFPFCASSVLLLLLTADRGLMVERVARLSYPEQHWYSSRQQQQQQQQGRKCDDKGTLTMRGVERVA